MTTTRAGLLRHLVTFQQPNDTRGTQGNLTAGWTTLAQRYASIKGISSIEKVTGEQVQGSTVYEVTIRYLTDLDMTCRMSFNGNFYKIIGLIDVDQNHIWQTVTVVNTNTRS